MTARPARPEDEPWRAAGLDPRKLPRHVAIIMDGNGRWAERRNLPRSEGHRAGTEAVRRVIRASAPIGLSALTLYAFSTENWKRPSQEVESLWRLVPEVFERDLPEIREAGVRVRVVGDRGGLPEEVRTAVARAEAETAANTGMVVTFAINYGGRDEIVRAARRLAIEAKAGAIDPTAIDEAALAARLDTAGLPELDLLVRTGGEMRVSNFLLWELAYAEFVSVPVLWPDFTADDLYRALAEYQRRDRRFGGVAT
ncbi:MAG: isoprenyl transferase [Clostridia bacterium]|nr:isoprenyl transferase [Clostridia bacterium]